MGSRPPSSTSTHAAATVLLTGEMQRQRMYIAREWERRVAQFHSEAAQEKAWLAAAAACNQKGRVQHERNDAVDMHHFELRHKRREVALQQQQQWMNRRRAHQAYKVELDHHFDEK